MHLEELTEKIIAMTKQIATSILVNSGINDTDINKFMEDIGKNKELKN